MRQHHDNKLLRGQALVRVLLQALINLPLLLINDYMNKEKFHNELAMRLGYERIVKDKRILISVEESDDPWVTLKIQDYDDFRFKASCSSEMNYDALPYMREDIVEIMNAVHQAYIEAQSYRF